VSLPLGLGGVEVASPAWLLALALLPLLFVGRRDAWRAGGYRAVAAAGCRALAAAAVVLTLAGPSHQRPRPAAGTCVVAAIDVSASMRRAAVEQVHGFLSVLSRMLGPHDLLGSVAFARRARVIARPRPGHVLAQDLLPPAADDLTGFETGETDIAAALSVAAALCPEGMQSALVLASDGNETEGSALAEAALLESGVRVFPVVPAPAALPAVSVRRLLAPLFAAEHRVLPLEVVVESRADRPLAATLALTANGELLASARTRIAPGMTVIPLPYRLAGAGQYLLEAALRPAGADTWEPAHGRTAVTVTRPLRALVASEREMPVVAAALAERGMRVEVVSPSGLVARATRLREQHLVVLDGLARAALAPGTLEAVAAYVAAGGGLVVTGGEHLFGDAGLVGTPLARILPVELRPQAPEPQEREPLALYLVIDRSNSMGYASGEPALANGEKIAYAKRAALAVLDQLGARDLVGAIAFDAQAYELAPLLPVRDCRADLAARIRALQHGGGTDFKEALDIARRNLIESGRAIRHVILLTDGDSNRGAEDHADLIAALARAAITVTTIRIGADTINLALLDAIARATGGEFHHVANVQALPQLLIRDTQRLMQGAGERREARVRVGEPGTILAGIAAEELPLATRWARTRPRHGAEVRLYVETGEEREPVLATWQYELGRVAVVPLDFQAGAAAWAAWDGFGKLWAQLAEWVAPMALPTDHHLEAHRLREGTRVTLTTPSDGAGPFVLRLPGTGDVPLREIGPRTFAATVGGLRAGRVAAVLLAGEGTRLVAEPVDLMIPATSPSGREQRSRAANRALLAELARATGGALDPEPGVVLAARAGWARARAPLEPILVPLALALVLADVALRRRL